MAEIKEQETREKIKKNVLFTFFSNQAQATPNKICETREAERIGLLTGIASEKTDGTGKWLIEFNLEIPPDKIKESTSRPIEGDPGENLVMLATLKSLSPDFTVVLPWASLGRIQQEGGHRAVIFDQWHPVEPSIEKTKIRALAERRQGQPLEAPDGSYIRYSEFKLI